jgi:glycerol-3-phosphate acyltransferase PlsY
LNCPNWLVVVYMGLSVFIIFKHRANIIRILHKTEPKFRV